MAAGTVAVILSADNVLVRPGWFSLFSLYNVLAFGGVALLWLRLRPSSRVGVLLLGITALTGLAALQGSSSPIVHSLGVVADPILTIVWIYLLLTFPTIRLDRASATVLAILVATVAIAFVPWFFFSKHVSGATPLARCTAACPENPFMIAERPGAAASSRTSSRSGGRSSRCSACSCSASASTSPRHHAVASSSRSTRSPPRGPSPSAPTAWPRT